MGRRSVRLRIVISLFFPLPECLGVNDRIKGIFVSGYRDIVDDLIFHSADVNKRDNKG